MPKLRCSFELEGGTSATRIPRCCPHRLFRPALPAVRRPTGAHLQAPPAFAPPRGSFCGSSAANRVRYSGHGLASNSRLAPAPAVLPSLSSPSISLFRGLLPRPALGGSSTVHRCFYALLVLSGKPALAPNSCDSTQSGASRRSSHCLTSAASKLLIGLMATRHRSRARGAQARSWRRSRRTSRAPLPPSLFL